MKRHALVGVVWSLGVFLAVSAAATAERSAKQHSGFGARATHATAAAPASAPAMSGVAAMMAAPSIGPYNGSFETNSGAGTSTFNGWAVTVWSGSSGSWYVQTGATSPLNAFTVQPPPDGAFAAMADQGETGSHLLYQDFTVPTDIPNPVLVFLLYVRNHADDYSIAVPPSLAYGGGPDGNQLCRVDIMDPNVADPFDVGSGVWHNVLLTTPGTDAEFGYVEVRTDVTPWQGETIRLRFAQVDTLDYLNMGVDAVRIEAAAAVPALEIPALAILAVIMAALALAVLGSRLT